jgi:ATP-dependent Clp protease ATP-binding subunit ClpA
MFDVFTEGARQIIFFARFEAGRLKCDDIDVRHLLLGFIAQDQGATDLYLRTFLSGAGEPTEGDVIWPSTEQAKESFLDPTAAAKLQSMFSSFGPRSDPQPMHGDMPLTEAAKNVLSDAFEHANGSEVTPLHLLWGMLGNYDAALTHTLTENGVTRERVDDAIRRRNRE